MKGNIELTKGIKCKIKCRTKHLTVQDSKGPGHQWPSTTINVILIIMKLWLLRLQMFQGTPAAAMEIGWNITSLLPHFTENRTVDIDSCKKDINRETTIIRPTIENINSFLFNGKNFLHNEGVRKSESLRKFKPLMIDQWWLWSRILFYKYSNIQSIQSLINLIW